MDRKQHTIYLQILDKFNLHGDKIQFIQHRNLREFKYFDIERLNPNHKIKLFGRLKNNVSPHNKSKKMIEVGEIIIGLNTICLSFNIILQNIDIICLILNMYFINVVFFYIFGKINIMRWPKLLTHYFLQKNSFVSQI